jgi:hypothetical protein
MSVWCIIQGIECQRDSSQFLAKLTVLLRPGTITTTDGSKMGLQTNNPKEKMTELSARTSSFYARVRALTEDLTEARKAQL